MKLFILKAKIYLYKTMIKFYNFICFIWLNFNWVI